MHLRKQKAVLFALLSLLTPASAMAQSQGQSSPQSAAVAPAQQTLKAEQLDALVAPIALYDGNA